MNHVQLLFSSIPLQGIINPGLPRYSEISLMWPCIPLWRRLTLVTKDSCQVTLSFEGDIRDIKVTCDINQRSHVDFFHSQNDSEPQRDMCYHPIVWTRVSQTGSDTLWAVWLAFSIGQCCDIIASGSSNLDFGYQDSCWWKKLFYLTRGLLAVRNVSLSGERDKKKTH